MTRADEVAERGERGIGSKNRWGWNKGKRRSSRARWRADGGGVSANWRIRL